VWKSTSGRWVQEIEEGDDLLNGKIVPARVSPRELALIVGQLISSVVLYVASQFGIFSLYVLSGILLAGLVVCTVGYSTRSSTRLFTIVLCFFVFRYIPIVKYGQPLFDDAWSDLRTAKFFADANMITVVPQMPNPALSEYSDWPPLHLLSIAISRVLGLQLPDVFTYFGPIVAFPSLIFVYLLARDLFGDSRKAAFSALVISTFSIPLFWQLQMVRQNMGISIFCGGLYTYVKFRRSRSLSALAISLVLFCFLPLVHHLTALVAIATLSLAFLLEGTRSKDRLSSGFLLLVASTTLLAWTTVQAQVVIPAMFGRLLGLISPERGDIAFIQQRLINHFDTYDLLTIVRMSCLACASLLGLVTIARRKSRFRGLLIAFFIASAIPLSVALFNHVVDERFALLLTLPVALLVGGTRPRQKWLLGLVLVLIVLPTPFKLYETFNAAPTYVFDANSSVNFGYGEFSKFRNTDAIMLARWNGRVNSNMVIVTDGYDIQILQQYYDPTMLYYLDTYDTGRITLTFFNPDYIAGRYTHSDLVNIDRVLSRGDLIYNDGAQVGYHVEQTTS
jgi:hypothetical protein